VRADMACHATTLYLDWPRFQTISGLLTNRGLIHSWRKSVSG
jgi:hypothetical protein